MFVWRRKSETSSTPDGESNTHCCPAPSAGEQTLKQPTSGHLQPDETTGGAKTPASRQVHWAFIQIKDGQPASMKLKCEAKDRIKKILCLFELLAFVFVGRHVSTSGRCCEETQSYLCFKVRSHFTNLLNLASFHLFVCLFV